MHTYSIYNDCTATYVIEASNEDAYPTADAAKRALQAWLLAEADACDSEDDAALLDNAAQELNYADWTHVPGTFDWTCAVETVTP